MTNGNVNLRYIEDEKFSQNAAEALLDRGQLVDFLASLGYEVEPSGGGYKGLCPACRRSAAYIGTNGTRHRIFWKCYDALCPSNNRGSKLVRNLLGLTRGFVEGQSLALAMRRIADFLGAESTWDVTNGKLPMQWGYVFLVDTPEQQARLEKAGIQAMVFNGDYADARLRRKCLVVVLEQDRERVLSALRAPNNHVEAFRPIFFFSEERNRRGEEAGLRRKAMMVLNSMMGRAARDAARERALRSA